MKYSKYFGYMTRNNGQPHLDLLQFQRMMNIISVEGVIYGLKAIKEKYKDTQGYYQYDTDIFNQEKILDRLSNDLAPDDLFKDLIESSEH